MPAEILQPRLGMRYGPDVWALRTGLLYSERTGKLVEAPHITRAGISPQTPSLKASVEGIQTSYGTRPVMGTDPEFFLSKDGQPIPAFDFLPDKHASTGGLFWDGFQAETLVDLKTCGWDCEKSCNAHKTECHAILAQRIGTQLQKLLPLGLQVMPRSVWRIPPRMLQLAGEAQVALGCDPSWNAYGSEGRCVAVPRMLEWRFAGGHVHFELEPREREDLDHIRYLIKTLDAILGVPSVCLAQNYDHFIRRRYYGLAGEYRLPPHGLEYRTLSNFWLMHPRAFMLVFDLARHALNMGRARFRNMFVGASNEQAIRDTINYCDVRSAQDFMRLNREFYSAWSILMYGSDRAFWEAIKGGLDKVISNWGQNVVQDWQLHASWTRVPTWRQLG